jgi:tetratricopeptide (TPR) repeat protein
MAKLSHPNVITVHDVGTFEGQVFVAMEFIEGGTLTMWLREKQRSWKEVRQVLVAAGRGLAAAHAAGLVHRDFKPDNVLMGRDGRVLVTDFGLARPAAGRTDAFASVGSMPGTRALGLSLTRTGALVGTPAYMAPEQLAGERTDALTDQFSFCVALYEGLYGERPFAGKVLAELIANVTDGRVRPAPAKSTVPRWLRRPLLRGLSVQPEHRHASMDALLAALARDPWRRWQQAALVAVPSLVVGGAFLAYENERPRATSYCEDVAEKLHGVWDDGVREAVRRRFADSGLPYAPDTIRAIELELDRYSAQWIELQAQACRDEVEGARPQPVLALQMTCLERRRESLDALTELLAAADPALIERSVDAVNSLPQLDVCADLEVMMARESIQENVDPERVQQVDAGLARAKVLRDATKFAEARAIVEPLVEVAAAAGYGRGEALARELLATTLDFAGDVSGAERAYHDALSSALASGSAEVVVRASLGLVWITGDARRPMVEAQRWYAHGKGALARMGNDPELAAELERALGQAFLQHGDPSGGEPHIRESMRIREEAFGTDHESISVAANSLGQLFAMQGDVPGAQAQFERALAINKARLGAAHPDTAAALSNLGTLLAETAQFEQATEYQKRALAILTAALGPDHIRTAAAHHNLAALLSDAGNNEEARVHAQRELELVTRAYGPDHLEVASAFGLLASIQANDGDHEAALAGYARAHEIAQRIAPDGIAASHHEGNMARELHQLGRNAEALSRVDEVIRQRAAALGAEHHRVADAMVDKARILIALRRADEAVDVATQATAITRAGEARPLNDAVAHFALARALWEAPTRGDKARAKQAVVHARDMAAKAGSPSLEAEIGEWIRTHE